MANCLEQQPKQPMSSYFHKNKEKIKLDHPEITNFGQLTKIGPKLWNEVRDII